MNDTDNVDFDEVDKFAALSAKWWDKNAEFKPLHDINPLRKDYIKSNFGKSLAGKKILDIGCGGGILSESLALEGAQVTGIDMAKSGLSAAKLHLLESGLAIDYQLITAEAFAQQQAGKFDIVCCLEMLEHTPDPASIITACANLTKPSGKVFLSTINRNPKSYLFAIIGAEYLLNLLPKGTHNYDKFIKPSEMDEYARAAKLSLKGITGMTYNPLTQVYKLSNDVSVNYLSCYQK